MQSSKKYSAKNGFGDKYRNIWEQYRPVTTINFSDIIEEKTIYDRTDGHIETTFESTDMENHPNIDPDAVSVDDILGNSIVHEIRHMSQSRHGKLSNSMRASIPNRFYGSHLGDDDIGDFTSDNLAKESFRPAEEMLDQIQKDENDWERSRADVPFSENDSISKSTSFIPPNLPSVPKIHKKLANMSDFSGYLVDSSCSTDLSIGRYFSNRCGDLQDMIPSKSPTKRHVPIPLFSSSIQHVEEKPRKKSPAKFSTSTYERADNERLQDSIASLSTIANQLEESDTDSPRTFLNKLYSNRNEAMTKENVELLKHAATQLKSCHIGFDVHPKQSAHVSRMNENVSSGDAFNNMMNSTKIDEKENERQGSSMDTDSLDSGASSTTNVTLGSGYSPIKTSRISKCDDVNTCSNKRSRSSVSYLDDATANSPPVKNLSPRQNQRNPHHVNGEAVEVSRTARYPPAPFEAPLDDISSSILNNYNRSSTKSNHSSETGAIRQCATDLGSFNSQRRYDSRSSVCMKMSLPAYGLQGIRNHYQEGITVDKRCNSQCSTHSEFTQNDGKFPLKSNTSELVWECVKLRKSVTKSLVIKNTSDKRLSLKVGVVGPGYQIASSCDSDSLVLQGNECRTINVTFCPTIIGKAMGKLTFKPIKNWPEEIERSVYLWAYGGSTVLQLQGIERGPVGSSFLKMGETSNIVTTTLERTFSIYNRGPLNGVATIFVKPKTNQCINENHITIEPNKCVIRPDGTATVKVIYKLRRKDIERLREKSCEVLTVGTLEVIFGSEPNRQRIASILTRQGNVPTSYKQLEFLVNDFPVARMEDFKDFREHVDNVYDLFGCFRTSEIALTINRTSLDETRNADLSCIDDSVLFRTLCETPKQKAKPQTNGTSPQTMHSTLWSVHPKSLKMDYHNSRKSIIVQSFFNHVQTFQIDSNIASYLNFSMKSGEIGPNGKLQIQVELKKNLHIQTLNGMITIYIESGSVDIPISVQPVPYSYM